MIEDILKIAVPPIIALLIIWLLYRMKRQVKMMVKNEIYNNLPSVKDATIDFEKRMDFLKNQADTMEKKIKEIEDRLTK